MLMEDLFREVDTRLERDEAEAALDMLQQALAVYPAAWSLRRALVFPLLKLRRGDEALQAAARALDLQPKDAALWQLVGELTIERDKEAAARALRNALLFEPADARTQDLIRSVGYEEYLYSDLRLAWLHLQQGLYDLAAEEMVEAEGEDAILARLGLMELAWRRNDSLEEAASIATGLLQLSPKLLPAVVVLAAQAKQRGSSSELEGWIRILRDLDPDGSGAKAAMADFLATYPVPEIVRAAVDVPIQEPLAKEDLEALEQLDQQLDAELMSLMVPEGHGLVDLVPPTMGSEEEVGGQAEPVAAIGAVEAAVPPPLGTEGLEHGLESEGVAAAPEGLIGTDAEAVSAFELEPVEKPTEAVMPPQKEPVDRSAVDWEAELATVSEVVAEAPTGEARLPDVATVLDGLGRRIAYADSHQLEELAAQVLVSRELQPELKHRLLAMAYRKMGLGLEAAGEIVISLRCRGLKRSPR